MSFLPLDLLKTGASELDIELSAAQLTQFDQFARLLVETNREFNLTRITDPHAIVVNHLLDSLLCLWSQEVGIGANVIDVGTGAGFPGIPIKIARPDLRLTLVDATQKKIGFIANVIQELGLKEAKAIHARAEELGRNVAYREQYDLVYARALAEMPVLVELCLALVRPGGLVVATKGPKSDTEINAARPTISQLGATIEKIVRTHIPGTDIARVIPVILKTRRTPSRYPRPYAQIVSRKHKFRLE
ncbi:MAG: 16S rRNA (guanine(527)-N(7))-methyltransferase RsmG [Armatimonadetes bacterium]|nr:16S rRNA (guanine(527)-N(7))-methyltransferase RsmG [Armatimonadota bacterium]